MSQSISTVVFLQTTDAEYRTWISAIDAAILAVGFTAASDTGQLNLATATKPSLSDQETGARMYRWNDGLTELYMRVGFGSGTDAATQAAFNIALGFATDGANSLSGAQKTGAMLNRISGNAAARSLRVSKSGAAASIIVDETNASAAGFCFGMDRSRDSAGAATANGCSLIAAGNLTVKHSGVGYNGRGYQEYAAASGGTMGPYSMNSRVMAAHPHTGATWARGALIGVAPVVFWDAGGQATLSTMVGSTTDFPTAGTSVTVPRFGTNHQYRRTPVFCNSDSHGYFLVIDE